MTFFACCPFIPQDKKYIDMKSSKKNFCGIVALERDLVSPSNREFVVNDLGHYLFQKTDHL